MKKYFIIFILLCVTILSYAQSYTIEGRVYRILPDSAAPYCDENSVVGGVEGVKVEIYALSNDPNTPIATLYTDANGTYSYTVADPSSLGSVFSICPSYDDYVDVGLSDVTTYDLVLLNEYIFGNSSLCPLRRICGDVDHDGQLTDHDITEIREHILLVDQEFEAPISPFISKQYTRTDIGNDDVHFPLDLWNQTDFADSEGNQYPFVARYLYNDDIYYYNTPNEALWKEKLHEYNLGDTASCYYPDWDFYIMCAGDVSGNAYFDDSSSNVNSESPSVNKKSSISYNSSTKLKTLQKSTTYTIDVKAKAADPIIGFQFQVALPADLINIVELNPNRDLTGYSKTKNFAIRPDLENSALTNIRTLWTYDASRKRNKGVNMKEEFTLFSIQIEALEDGIDVADLIQLTTDAFPIEFINENINLVDAEISISIN